MGFYDALLAGHRTLRTAAGVSISYIQNGEAIDIQAIPGVSRFRSEAFDGGIIESRSRDYSFEVEDFTFTEPQKGDVIVESGQQYKVMRDDGGGEVWRWADSARQVIRVHAKHIGTAASFSCAFSSDFNSEDCS